MKKEILAGLKESGVALDFDAVEKVFDFAKAKYDEIGEDMSSPIFMMDVVSKFKPDFETVCAVILHHLHGDDFLKDEEVKNLFGKEVFDILSEVKGLEALNYSANDKKSKVEVLRRMFFAMVSDIRVLIVLLACRLYKMRNLDTLMEKKEGTFFARETLELYVPVAARLGIYSIKTELEDVAFEYLNPLQYSELKEEVEKLRRGCNISINYIQKKLEGFFKERGIEAVVSGRMKNIYSIYKKLQRKGLTSPSDLYDIFAMRIVLPVKININGKVDIDHLYGVLGMVHSEWRPISRRFKDYIAVPKPNGYRSLHTCVLGLGPEKNEQPVEVQIRDQLMHEDSEYGVAAHWSYKNGGGDVVSSRADWIKGLEQFSADFEDDGDKEVAREAGLDVLSDRVFVLTPRGEVKDLPTGANTIDFAYAVHTDVGNKCVMAKCNGAVVPLDYELKSGDVVEIITKKDSTPRLQWLSIAKTSLARNRIRGWFGGLNRDKNIKEGRGLLNSQLDRIGKPLLDHNYSILKNYLGRNLSLVDRESLVEEVGKGSKIASDVIKKVFPYITSVVDRVVEKKEKPSLGIFDYGNAESLRKMILVGGESGLPVKLASCCKPKLNDDILGYVTRGNYIKIHKSKCSHISRLNPDRIVFAQWKTDSASSTGEKYLVGLMIEAFVRVGLMSDVSSVIASMGIHIRDVQLKEGDDEKSYEYFLVELDNLNLFDKLVDRIEALPGVIKVTRASKS